MLDINFKTIEIEIESEIESESENEKINSFV